MLRHLRNNLRGGKELNDLGIRIFLVATCTGIWRKKETFLYKPSIRWKTKSAEQPFRPVDTEICSWLCMRLTWLDNLVQRGTSMLCWLRRNNITSIFEEYHSWSNSFMRFSTKHRLLRKFVNSSTSLVYGFRCIH